MMTSDGQFLHDVSCIDYKTDTKREDSAAGGVGSSKTVIMAVCKQLQRQTWQYEEEV